MSGKIPVTETSKRNSHPGSTAAGATDRCDLSRRNFIKNSAGFSAVSLAGAAGLLTGCDDSAVHKQWAEFFQASYRLMNEAEKAAAVQRLETRYSQIYGKQVAISTAPAQQGVLFGAALNLQKCIGCRRCVKACTIENNPSRGANKDIEWIRVIKTENDRYHLPAASNKDSRHGNNSPTNAEATPRSIHTTGEHHYSPDSENVPQPGSHYLPISCMHCENPPCVKVCPVAATYKEPDGIVVVDYNWCIGCRMCVQACPYWARRFNWEEPRLPKHEINPNTHYLGNRPRMKGVVEKCTFCIQRVRRGRYPACVEVCPTGARKFGNLLDPNSDVRQVLANKRVFQLKAELNTDPKFFYFMD